MTDILKLPLWNVPPAKPRHVADEIVTEWRKECYEECVQNGMAERISLDTSRMPQGTRFRFVDES